MQTLIFDLDGTLIDTSKIVIPAFVKALQHFPDITIPNKKAMLLTFGLPDKTIWDTLLPDCPETIRSQAGAFASDYIREGLLTEDVLLPDARRVLEALLARNHRLTIASNCGNTYLNTVLDSQGLRPYFEHPLCLESVAGYSKADILAEHIQRFGRKNCVMIGDRNTDIEAAKFHHLPAIGCHFGFSREHELDEADYLITKLPDLLDIFHSDLNEV